MSDADAAIRHAAKRLIAAVQQEDRIEVTVRRQDIALLMAAVARGRRLRGIPDAPSAPTLHPAQQ